MASPTSDVTTGRETAVSGAPGGATAKGSWIVLRTFPHAANTDATSGGGAGNFFAAASASTTRIAASERCRPLTHQESCTLMPADVG